MNTQWLRQHVQGLHRCVPDWALKLRGEMYTCPIPYSEAIANW